jgi:hypothetical protein
VGFVDAELFSPIIQNFIHLKEFVLGYTMKLLVFGQTKAAITQA